jgi:DNA-binding transcriptional LysR family regulator
LNFNLKQLEAFIWVSDLGSFRKAADRLNTTQPNISARISALESILGVKLMERDAGSVRLTTKGREMLEHARAVFRATDGFIEAANQKKLHDGVLRLGVTEMVVHTWVREFLRVLKHRYPNITVELTVDLSINLEKELFERSIDLAFQNGPFNRQTTGNKELGVFPLIWIASPKIGLQGLDRVTIDDMVRFPILTHARSTLLYAEVEAHFGCRRDLPARLVGSSNLAACIHMAVDGYGVATVPETMVIDELESGELSRVNYDWTPESLSFVARYDAEKSAGFVAKAAEIGSEVSFGFAQALINQ